MNCVHCGQRLCSTCDGYVLCSACIERDVDHARRMHENNLLFGKPKLPDVELPKLTDVEIPKLAKEKS